MRLTLDEYYLRILKEVTKRSTCGRRSVGAIIVDCGGSILSTGYNGVPKDWQHCTDVPCGGYWDKKGNSENCFAVHAEINAILQCHRLDLAHTMYVSCSPCFNCAKTLLNTPIHRIVTIEKYSDERGTRMWEQAGREIQLL